jgi:hypothetical protein
MALQLWTSSAMELGSQFISELAWLDNMDACRTLR